MASNRLTSYQEYFNHLPRSVLECSAREELLPECDLRQLHNRLHSVKADNQNLVFLLEQREQDCVSLQHQLRDLQGSNSWKITAPIRALVHFFRLLTRLFHFLPKNAASR